MKKLLFFILLFFAFTLTSEAFSNDSTGSLQVENRRIVTVFSGSENTNLNSDHNGNVVSTNNNGQVTTTTYDLFDRPIQITDSQGNTRNYIYDKTGNILTTQVKNANNEILQSTTFEYDNEGKKLKETQPVIPALSVIPANAGIGQNVTTTFTYNTDGTLHSQTDPNGNVTTYTYDTLNRLETTTLPNGLQTKNTYNKLNQIVKKEIISTSKTVSTRYEYDADGRVTKEIDDNNKSTLYTYNTLNQVTSITDKKGTTTSYTYDYRGKVLSETTPVTTQTGILDKIIHYQYDIA